MIYFIEMNLKDIGEFELIDKIKNLTGPQPGLILGIGDDACAWQNDAAITLAATDSLVENVHFDLEINSWQDLGWKALAVSLSDLAAMGAKPQAALVSLALTEKTLVESVLEFYRGLLEIAGVFKVAIAGGNVSSASQVNITITVTGTGDGADRILKRSEARAGQKIAVTGFPGSAAAGLWLLKNRPGNVNATHTRLKQSFLRPFPRITESEFLVKTGVKTAIDTSDGLLADLKHILNSSRLSANIDADILPASHLTRASFTKNQALDMVLTGGEDYELLFTASHSMIQEVSSSLNVPVTVIGDIIEGPPGKINLLGEAGNKLQLARNGWRHFD